MAEGASVRPRRRMEGLCCVPSARLGPSPALTPLVLILALRGSSPVVEVYKVGQNFHSLPESQLVRFQPQLLRRQHECWIWPNLLLHSTAWRGRLRPQHVHSRTCTKPRCLGLQPVLLSWPHPLCLVQVTSTHRVAQRAGASESPLPLP